MIFFLILIIFPMSPGFSIDTTTTTAVVTVLEINRQKMLHENQKFLELSKTAVSIEEFNFAKDKLLAKNIAEATCFYLNKHYPVVLGEQVLYKGNFSDYYPKVIAQDQGVVTIRFENGSEQALLRNNIQKRIPQYNGLAENEMVKDNKGYVGTIAAIYDDGTFKIEYQGYENRWYTRTAGQLSKLKP